MEDHTATNNTNSVDETATTNSVNNPTDTSPAKITDEVISSTSTDSDIPTPSVSDPIKDSIPTDITSDQITELKNEAIEYAKQYAKKGTSTRKEPSPDLANDQGPYVWWENQATYESNTWSVSFWEYDNQYWQLQATKVELQPDGRSRMTAYSMRKDSDISFPGFQVYKEQSDDRYHQAAIEDIVYLNRVLRALKDS
jgi:hypothetical protein